MKYKVDTGIGCSVWDGEAEAYLDCLEAINSCAESSETKVKMIKDFGVDWEIFVISSKQVSLTCGPITITKIEEEDKTNETDTAPAENTTVRVTKEEFLKEFVYLLCNISKIDKFLDNIEKVLGSSAVDAFCEAAQQDYMIKLFEKWMGDNQENINYFIYECEGDYVDFSKRVDAEFYGFEVIDAATLYDFIVLDNAVEEK